MVLVVNDVFQSVIVPRAVGKRFRISFLVYRGLWMVWPLDADLEVRLFEEGEQRFVRALGVIIGLEQRIWVQRLRLAQESPPALPDHAGRDARRDVPTGAATHTVKDRR